MRAYLKEHTNPPVFVASAVVVVGFVLWGVISPSSVSTVASATNDFITNQFEWLYIFGASAFVIFVLWLMFSRYGSIRLGPNDSKPEYSNLSWFAMLFTAGMGIGLVYYAVSEPVYHFLNPPTGDGATPQAATDAMNYTFFHWGFHPWAIYIVLGLSLGYFSFRRGLPMRPASALYPLIGDRIYGWPGNLVDVLAVFGTLFGLATSLGLGGQQVGAGLEVLFGIPNTTTLQVIIILAITSVAVVSVMLGIDKGIRNLSLLNLWLAFALMLFVFFFGPDPRPAQRVRHQRRQLRADAAEHRLRDLPQRRRAGPGVAGRLDPLLLGLVDLLVAVRRHVHRPHLLRAHHPAVHRRRALRARRCLDRLADRLRRLGPAHAARRPGQRAGGGAG